MTKVRLVALFVLLSVALFAGSAAAGPGGCRNGDPDGPQISHPLAMPRTEEGSSVKPSVSPEVVASEKLPYSWRVVLRLYLRIHGIALR
jgi:hypothetical protein